MKRFTMTPQPRKSIKIPTSAIRPGPLSSRLSLNTEDLKPTRNVRDKQYKQECVENIIEFLASNGYDSQVTAKSLSNPSNKEFQGVFKFIYSFIDPTPFTRFEDDAMSIVKMLKYPYASEITRSQLTAVTPHTWPVLLSMLSWLVDLVRLSNKEEETPRTVEKAFLEYVCVGYTMFMEGNEEEDEYDSEFVGKVELMYAKEADEVESARQELREKERELEEYRSKMGGVAVLERRKKKIAEDLNTLIAHERQLESKKNKYISAIEKLADEIKGYEESVNELISIKNDLLEQINQQTVHPSDIQGMNVEKVNLYKELERLKPEREAVVKSALALENTIAEKVDENERVLSELIGKYPLRSLETELLELRTVNAAIGNRQEVWSSGQSKDLGLAVIQRLEDVLAAKHETLVNNEIHIATLEESIADKTIQLRDFEDQYEHLTNKLKTVGAIYLEKKELADRTHQKSRNEVDKLDNDLLKLKLESDTAYLKSEKECSEARIKLDLAISTINRERDDISRIMWQFYNTVEQQFKVLEQLKKELSNLTH